MARKKIEKSKGTQPKRTQGGSKQQTQQVVEPASHSPMEISDPFTGMFSKMMPMVVMILMFAILTPMLKGIATE